jgi:hypothetical protein
MRSKRRRVRSKERAGLTLEGVVDEPLESGEGTDHEDTGTETSPETGESDFRVDGSDRGLGLSRLQGSVEFTDHSICGVGNDSAEDTGNVTTGVSLLESVTLFQNLPSDRAFLSRALLKLTQQ